MVMRYDNKYNSIERLGKRYLHAIPYIKNNDVVVDICSADGSLLHYIKERLLKEKRIENITTVGIDIDNHVVNKLDRFIHSDVILVEEKNFADVVTFFGSSIEPDHFAQAFTKMHGFLKSDGIAIIEMRIMGDVTKATKEDKKNYDDPMFIIEKYHEKHIKILTKEELLEHSKHEEFVNKSLFCNGMVKSCKHGKILHQENHFDEIHKESKHRKEKK